MVRKYKYIKQFNGLQNKNRAGDVESFVEFFFFNIYLFLPIVQSFFFFFSSNFYQQKFYQHLGLLRKNF